ncbi:MAG: hypothetical protein IJ608_04085 [Lachnospiraceae bacterium]|nr:hypothetical protein [Lachnospiraceae bacterium]
MKNYESPVVLENENLAEGVFAASGAVTNGEGDCWYFNRAWTDNLRLEEEYMIWHVEWIHDASKTPNRANHHSGGFNGTLTLSGPALVDVYNPGWDNQMTVSRIDDRTIQLNAYNEWHYTNAGPESKTFNIGIKSNSINETVLLEIVGGSMNTCYACNQHPNG